MGTLFKYGTVITAGEMTRADVLVEGEIVTLLGRDIPTDGHTVVDCTGKYLLPGGIDVHTHLDLSFGGTYSNDDYDTGHKAAAYGGTTMHIDFVIQPKGGSLHDGLKEWQQKAKLAQIDYACHPAITDLRHEIVRPLQTSRIGNTPIQRQCGFRHRQSDIGPVLDGLIRPDRTFRQTQDIRIKIAGTSRLAVIHPHAVAAGTL